MKGTIHIFGYGESQIISEEVNFKAPVGSFTKLQAVIDNIKSLKPADKTDADYHAINIFSDGNVNYMARRAEGAILGTQNTSSFSVKYTDLDTQKIYDLVVEFDALSKA